MTAGTELIPLYSSSQGNSTLIKINGVNLLIDCGKSCKMIGEALIKCGVYPDDISAVFLTHGHSDHIQGITVFTKKYHTPVYATKGTMRKITDIYSEVTYIAENDIISFKEHGFEVWALPTPHDIEGSVVYKIRNLKTKKDVCVMTDLGQFTPAMQGFARGSAAILLESNYDRQMLKDGPYPYPLKMRIASGHGHISNDICHEAAEFLIREGTTKIMLGHLSPTNNTEEIALDSFIRYMKGRDLTEGRDYIVKVASKTGPTEGFSV
ncbi:MAG: MBL fold metallo-hydrolase [Saccharofermentans sp.]|nr:MBL fold metallo-hydrolase [Saccharofermentans sp.]